MLFEYLVTRELAVYLDRRDAWIGYHQGDEYHYLCPLPFVVIRWKRLT
jgi:hypothetical protein